MIVHKNWFTTIRLSSMKAMREGRCSGENVGIFRDSCGSQILQPPPETFSLNLGDLGLPFVTVNGIKEGKRGSLLSQQTFLWHSESQLCPFHKGQEENSITRTADLQKSNQGCFPPRTITWPCDALFKFLN